MKFYVASKFNNYRKVQQAVDELLNRGFEITFHWAGNDNEFDEDGELIKTMKELTPREATDFAYLDLQGAMEADAVLLLYVDEMRGAFIETGAALAMGHQVYVVGDPAPTIFWHLPNVKVFPFLSYFFDHLDAHGA